MHIITVKVLFHGIERFIYFLLIKCMKNMKIWRYYFPTQVGDELMAGNIPSPCFNIRAIASSDTSPQSLNSIDRLCLTSDKFYLYFFMYFIIYNNTECNTVII